MNDVLLYGWWLQLMQQGEAVFGVRQPFVYPYPSLLPMWIASYLGGSAGILVGWTGLISLLNLTIIGTLTGWGRAGREAFFSAWLFLGFIACLGPVATARIDAISVSLAIFGTLAFFKGRVFAASVFFTLGAWIKIWPFVLALGAIISAQNKKVIAYAVTATCAAVGILATFLGANQSLFSFVFTQADRGIQIESPIATPWLWAAKFGTGNARLYFDEEIITNQISGDFVELFANLMTPVMFGALAITIWLGIRAIRAKADPTHVFAAFSMTAVLDLIVFNKVGSPQFMIWLVVPMLALLLARTKVKSLALVTLFLVATLTHLVYPVLYIELLALGDLSLVLLTIRNLLLVGLLVWANLQLGNLAKSRLGIQ